MASLEAICIAPAAAAPMQALSEVEAVPGVGLSGDRYLLGIGYYSPTPGFREVTLFEAEVLDWLASEHDISFSPTDHRRNLTTRGISLSSLLGHRFRIGEVLLEGMKDCPPCTHLEGIVHKPVLRPLTGRGGLRGRIVEGGTLRVGDPIALD
jgi:MOSC domain-containing protein YiiM